MPAWQGRLSEHSIDTVIAYVLSIGKEQTDDSVAKEYATTKPIVSQHAALGKALFCSYKRQELRRLPPH